MPPEDKGRLALAEVLKPFAWVTCRRPTAQPSCPGVLAAPGERERSGYGEGVPLGNTG